MRFSMLFFILIIYVCFLRGQSKDTSLIKSEIAFIEYLMDKNYYADALFQLNKIRNSADNIEDKNSINYLSGLSHFSLKQLDSSTIYFNKVSIKSELFYPSRFYAAYGNMYLKNTAEAYRVLNEIPVLDTHTLELKNFELAGLALLRRDYESYLPHSSQFSHNWYPLIKEEEILDTYYREMQDFNPKSLALAGIMSAIIPGSGKIYAGKIGGGLAAFFTLGILGSITVENYIKDGTSSAKTWIFGSLFTIFYIGNIYGSVASVKLYRDEFYLTHDKSILFNLQIPLRNIYH